MRIKLKKAIQLITVIIIGILMVATVVAFARKSSVTVRAAGPIPPPDGYPKLNLSTKVVTPTLAYTDGAVLKYNLEIINTGAYTATDVTLTDKLPAHATYDGNAWSSAPPTPVITDGVLTWPHGVVGFDSSVVITFSVTVTPGYAGIVSNTAVITDPMIAAPVMVQAETRVTDQPIFTISKTASPEVPGPNKPLTYELTVGNQGQKAVGTPLSVTDFVPADTTFRSMSPGGQLSPAGDIITWTRPVTMSFGETTAFTFSVDVGDVPSGTLIHNGIYFVNTPYGLVPGEPVDTPLVDPILHLSKGVNPDPPGSNAEMTYILTVLNLGSKATNLVISDTVPANVTYVRGGDNYANGIVSWKLPSLDTRESAQVTYTVFIADIADVSVLNDTYLVCSSEGVCANGEPVPSLVVGPTFAVTATLEPIAKKPGGGTGPVTPTLTVENLGPGNALDATALITFGRISVSLNDMAVTPTVGTLVDGPPCNVNYPCKNFLWTGNVAVGDVITFTTPGGQSTIGGEQGQHYTATLVITDDLGGYVTEPVTGTAVGLITHYANLVPSKSAPAVIGAGQVMTYTIQVFDSGLSADVPPYPTLTETVPASLTLLSISDGGISQTVGTQTVISWTLPALGPGDYLFRNFSVLVDPGLISGTQIVNDDYRTTWFETEVTGTLSNLGTPITTTVHEVGLIDSYKTVTPTLALPGKDNVLTYVVHAVNSGPYNLQGVKVRDIFPWQSSTYQRDAVATAGTVVSDIVSLDWTVDVAPFSEQLITFTVLVDDHYQGEVTNIATISHPSLKEDKVVKATAYITDKPVLRISKLATPSLVDIGSPLLYQVTVTNLGQQATLLVVTDTVPLNTTYIPGSASSGGELVDGVLKWQVPVLNPGEKLTLTYQVTVDRGMQVINALYGVTCSEGVSAAGEPVITPINNPTIIINLPLLFRN